MTVTVITTPGIFELTDTMGMFDEILIYERENTSGTNKFPFFVIRENADGDVIGHPCEDPWDSLRVPARMKPAPFASYEAAQEWIETIGEATKIFDTRGEAEHWIDSVGFGYIKD